jgi:hypothetical protein
VVGIYVLSLARATALVGAWFMYSAGTVSCADAEKAPTTMLLLVEKDNDRTVDIRQGESVRISLPENATSGYRWAIDRYRTSLSIKCHWLRWRGRVHLPGKENRHRRDRAEALAPLGR